MARVLCLLPDLMLRSRVMEAAKAAGLETTQDPAAAGIVLVLADLDAATDRLAEWKAAGYLEGRQVVGIYSHVHDHLRETGARAGCGHFLTRGQLATYLPSMLQSVAGSP